MGQNKDEFARYYNLYVNSFYVFFHKCFVYSFVCLVLHIKFSRAFWSFLSFSKSFDIVIQVKTCTKTQQSNKNKWLGKVYKHLFPSSKIDHYGSTWFF